MKWYYLNTASEKVGPVSSQALKKLAENRIVQRCTVVISEDGKQFEAWKIQGLFPELEKKKTFVPIPPTQSSSIPIPPPLPTSLPTLPALPIQPVNDPFAAFSFPSPSTHASFQPDPLASFSCSATPSAKLYPSENSSNGIMFAVCGCLLGMSVLVAVFVFCVIPKSGTDQIAGSDVSVSVSEKAAEKKYQSSAAVIKSKESSSLTGHPSSLKDISELENTAPAGRLELRSTEEIIADVEGSIALINGKNSSGSGFVVFPGVVATNSHVINAENISDLEVIFPSERGTERGGPFTARLLYEDSDRDLAFLEIPVKKHLPINIVQNYKFRRGQKVVVIGNPGKGDGTILENAVCEGVLSTQTEMDNLPYYQLSIAVNSGNSGGPVLDETGCVLGVVTLKAAKTEAMAYCIPPDAFLRALDETKRYDTNIIKSAADRHAARVPLFRGLNKLGIFKEVAESKHREFALEAITDFDEAIQKNPQEPLAFFGRGIFKLITEDIDNAMNDFDKAVQLAPDKPEIAEVRDAIRTELERRRKLSSSSPFPGRNFASRFSVPPMTAPPSLPPPTTRQQPSKPRSTWFDETETTDDASKD